MNDFEKILKQIEKLDLNYSEKEHLEQSAYNSIKIGVPIILNTYQMSNVLGVKWDTLKKMINNSQKKYHNFDISKRSGGKRKISMPERELKEVQKLIKEKILENITISEKAYGFVKNKSIKTNAKEHLNKEKILNIDLKDFFPSIHRNRIYYIFKYLCGYSNDVSFCLTKLVTYKNSLPQGAPTSPILSNIVAFMMDIRLEGLAKKLNIKYTRYADDITFSGNKEVINDKLLECLKNIIDECGFVINEKKTRFANRGSRQEVTGLIVNNNTINVPRKYIREIRQELYYIKKYGLKEHRKKVGFENKYYKDHLLGKILYVKSINYLKGTELLNGYNKIKW